VSGGHFEYENGRVDNWISVINDDITQFDIPEKWKTDFTEEQLEAMGEFRKLLRHVSKLLSSYDYAFSGDTDFNDFLKDWEDYKNGV